MSPHETQAATSSTQPSPDTNTHQSRQLTRSAYTPIPNVLLDEVMPTLSGSEWQLLCVIVRQTQGWHDPNTGGRKTSDWMSHKQLKARTGRGSDAVCHAIDSLVHLGHIEVKDEGGHPLTTAAERRRNGSRLYYGLSLELLSHFDTPASNPPDPVRESRIGKAETTKETQTKPYGEAFGKSQTSSFQPKTPRSKATNCGDGCGCLAHSPNSLNTAKFRVHDSVPSSNHSKEVSRIVGVYQDLIQNQKTPRANFSTSLSQEYVDQLEKALWRYGEEQLLALMEAFFQSDFTLMKRNSSLASFIDSVHILAARRFKDRSVAATQ